MQEKKKKKKKKKKKNDSKKKRQTRAHFYIFSPKFFHNFRTKFAFHK